MNNMALIGLLDQKTKRKNTIKPNLLTANQATASKALGTNEGFTSYKGDETFTPVATGLEVTTDGSDAYEGVTLTFGATSVAHTLEIKLNGTSGKNILILFGSGHSTEVTTNGTDQVIRMTNTPSNNLIYILTNGTLAAIWTIKSIIARVGTY